MNNWTQLFILLTFSHILYFIHYRVFSPISFQIAQMPGILTLFASLTPYQGNCYKFSNHTPRNCVNILYVIMIFLFYNVF